LNLGGHSALSKSDTLEFAETNDTILLRVPSHTTQVLQPMDRPLFRSLKDYFKLEGRHWMLQHSDRKSTEFRLGYERGRNLRQWKSELLEIEQQGYTHLTKIQFRCLYRWFATQWCPC
jgi:hypothetical protein